MGMNKIDVELGSTKLKLLIAIIIMMVSGTREKEGGGEYDKVSKS
jgi:hypothetical protein